MDWTGELRIALMYAFDDFVLSPSGRIPRGFSGNVKESGVNVVGATVWLLDSNGVLLYTTTTDASGNYAFLHDNLLTANLYEVAVVGPTGDDYAIHGKLTPGPP
jgi:hypothetical protein